MSVRVPQPGDYIAGKYRIDDHIGSGGFAEVFLVEDAAGMRYALKLLVPGQQEWQQAAGQKLIERFEREGELLGRLQNEHTVKMVEMGRTSDNLPYIVFEFVDGVDLADLVEEQGPLPPGRVVTILKQVCSALKEAHDLGVMHRDIKPANIMVYQHLGIQGLVKLLDFGIAKPQASGDGTPTGATLTTAGMVLGTPRYMAPEQFTGAQLAPTSDIYSLGLVAFELVTGQPAVDAETTTGIFRQQLSPDEFKLPRSADVPSSLRRIIEKMTKKSRKDRYQSVDEVLLELEAWQEDSGTIDQVVRGAAVALVALILAVGGAWVVLGPKGEQRQASAEPSAAKQQKQALDELVVTPLEESAKPSGEGEGETTGGSAAAAGEEGDEQKTEQPEEKDEKIEKVEHKTADDDSKKPPPDNIRALRLKSEAEAKAVASNAYTMADWRRVIAACKPFGPKSTFCAKMLAEAYKNRGDFHRACFWFDTIEDHKHGIDCEDYPMPKKDDEGG